MYPVSKEGVVGDGRKTIRIRFDHIPFVPGAGSCFLEFRDFVEGSLEKMKLNIKLFGDLFAMNQLMGANDYVVGIMLLYFGDFLNLIDRVIKYANEKEELAATDAQEIVRLDSPGRVPL